jgi:hypothetical protein
MDISRRFYSYIILEHFNTDRTHSLRGVVCGNGILDDWGICFFYW